MLLVSLLFTAGALSVRNITGATLKRDAYVLANNIGAVHTRAVTKNAYFRMVFDLEENTYTTELADTRFFIGQGKQRGGMVGGASSCAVILKKSTSPVG